MNGGTHITSGIEKEKEGEMVEGEKLPPPHHQKKKKVKQGKEDATAAAFVKRCQIFNPGVLSVLLCNR